MSALPDSWSDEFKRINADRLREVGHRHVLPISDEDWAKRAEKDEKELQILAENILSLRKYRRLTAVNAKAAHKGDIEVRGWYSHRQDTKRGNKGLPFKPDIEVFEAMHRRPPLLVELKHAPVRWRPGQREMAELGFWKLACTLVAFVGLLDEWERG